MVIIWYVCSTVPVRLGSAPHRVESAEGVRLGVHHVLVEVDRVVRVEEQVHVLHRLGEHERLHLVVLARLRGCGVIRTRH